MEGLIEALQLFLRYGNPAYPTHCEHDVLTICGINPDDVSPEDKSRLEKMGFIVSSEFDAFISYRYGSA